MSSACTLVPWATHSGAVENRLTLPNSSMCSCTKCWQSSWDRRCVPGMFQGSPRAQLVMLWD